MNNIIEKIKPCVYVGSYAKYNNGSIEGKWLDLEDYEDLEAFYAACKKLHKDEEDPELMFQDWEYIPKSMVGECWIDNNFYDLLDTVGRSSLDYEVYLAAIDNGLDYEDLEDHYMGEHDSDEDFTLEMLGEPDPTHFAHYHIDWESCARDYMQDFTEIEGHYFSNS